jgi:hypothetical protein
MNRIEIRQVITPFEKISLYDVYDSRAEEMNKKYMRWINGYFENGCWIYEHKCPVTKKEIQSLNYVDKIYFYPEENKFEIMLNGKLFKTIISKEYSITSFVEKQ